MHWLICLLQSKKANFDASHELEELLLEDNPLKARQRKVQDINNLSAEMRQMEEQCVYHRTVRLTSFLSSLRRFTSYDFKKMARRSYYPQNQQIVSTVTATSSTGVVSRPVTPTEVGQAESTTGSTLGQKVARQASEPPDVQNIPMADVHVADEKAYAM